MTLSRYSLVKKDKKVINEIIMKAKVTKKETDWENTLKLYHIFCLFVNDLIMYFIFKIWTDREHREHMFKER